MRRSTATHAALLALALTLVTRATADVQRFEILPFPHAPAETWTRFETSVDPGQPTTAPALGQPFRFATRVAEGNHRVTLTLGSPTTTRPSTITVKAEARRLMLERVHVPPGQLVTRSFIVNVRTPALPDSDGDNDGVKLSPRERGTATWDDALSLEFLGEHVVVSGIEVEPVDDAPTIFLAGDSTVTDQSDEPWAGWGQMLPRFVRHDVAVANHAESGRSLTSFSAERRLEKVLAVARAGDVLLVQFGHNDMKERGPGAGAFDNFAANLRRIVASARARGLTPVLLTPMHRRRFDASGRVVNSFGDYVEAVRRVAREVNAPLIDLNVDSATLYEALGPTGSTRAFVHYPANTFPGQPEALKDDTHHNNYGAYELARCVVERLRSSDQPSLRALIAPETSRFDPARPDAADAVTIAPSDRSPLTRPEGR